MDVRAQIDLRQLAQRMTSDTGRQYDVNSATAFLRGAGCQFDGEEWLVPLIVLGVLLPDEIRLVSQREDSQAS